jgi:flagellin
MINRMDAVDKNISNAVSFLQAQDGILESASKIVQRMSNLKVLSLDVSKNSLDIANYNTEFQALQQQLQSITAETFNGVSLFASTTRSGGTTTFGTDKNIVSVFTSDRGAAGSIVSLHKATLLAALTFNGSTAATASTDAGATGGTNITLANQSNMLSIGALGISFFTKALENIATLRAENGATMTRLQFAEDHLRLTSANLEAANSRIMDVDVASESTALAKYNILSQASAAMLAQANMSQSTALMLLG